MPGVHPVLDQQLAANGMGAAAGERPQVGEGFLADFGLSQDGDPRVSRLVAGMVLGAALTLFLLRVAGFRFSFGASIGGGG